MRHDVIELLHEKVLIFGVGCWNHVHLLRVFGNLLLIQLIPLSTWPVIRLLGHKVVLEVLCWLFMLGVELLVREVDVLTVDASQKLIGTLRLNFDILVILHHLLATVIVQNLGFDGFLLFLSRPVFGDDRLA